MTEYIDKLDSILEDIEVIKKEVEGGVDMTVKAMLRSNDIVRLCECFSKIDVCTPQGWDYIYNKMTIDQFWGAYVVLLETGKSDKTEELRKIMCQLTLDLLDTALAIPCKLGKEVDNVGYLEACEETLGFYVPQEEFEEAHGKCHLLIEMFENQQHLGGRLHKIHQN